MSSFLRRLPSYYILPRVQRFRPRFSPVRQWPNWDNLKLGNAWKSNKCKQRVKYLTHGKEPNSWIRRQGINALGMRPHPRCCKGSETSPPHFTWELLVKGSVPTPPLPAVQEVLSCNRVNWAKISPQNCNTGQGRGRAASNSGRKGWITTLWITCGAPLSERQSSKGGKSHDTCLCS